MYLQKSDGHNFFKAHKRNYLVQVTAIGLIKNDKFDFNLYVI